MGLVHIADATGEIILDVAHEPLILSCWRGKLSVEVVAEFFEFTNRVGQAALDSMTRLAYVNHVDDAERPSSEVRRAITELTVALQRAGRGAPTVGSWQVIRNPVIRGVMTTLQWVSRDIDRRMASSWEDGITRAIAALELAGQPMPPGSSIDPASYQFPHAPGQPHRRAN
jgi:hypothetical protein